MNTGNVDKVVYPTYNLLADNDANGQIVSDVVIRPRVRLVRDVDELAYQHSDTCVSTTSNKN